MTFKEKNEINHHIVSKFKHISGNHEIKIYIVFSFLLIYYIPHALILHVKTTKISYAHLFLNKSHNPKKISGTMYGIIAITQSASERSKLVIIILNKIY